jgi:peptide methionine sulfoxide reductase MsrA
MLLGMVKPFDQLPESSAGCGLYWRQQAQTYLRGGLLPRHRPCEAVQITYDRNSSPTISCWKSSLPASTRPTPTDSFTTAGKLPYRRLLPYPATARRGGGVYQKARTERHLRRPHCGAVTPAVPFYPAEEYHQETTAKTRGTTNVLSGFPAGVFCAGNTSAEYAF